MDFEKISQKAFKKEPIGEKNSLSEKYAYLRMRQLYSLYEKKQINKEQATKKKNETRKEYHTYSLYETQSFEICKNYNEDRVKIETELYKVEKSNSKEEVVEPLLNIVSMLLNDDSLPKRIQNKISGK